jgi:riboflavin synthase
VDGTGKLLSLTPASPSGNHSNRTKGDWWLRIELPEQLERYVTEKGSITVEGISLTIAQVAERKVTIAVIPHTYGATNLRSLREGDPVNIEVDVLAKYAEKLAAKPARSRITLERLMREGF